MTSRILKSVMMAIAFLACSVNASAQDLLVKTNGNIEKVKVLEVTVNEVKYKMWDNQDGPIFTVRQNQIISIKFENGLVQKFGGTSVSNSDDDSSANLSEGLFGKGYDNVLSLYLQDGWGIGYDIRKNFNKYIAWDIFGFTYMSGFYSPGDAGTINLRLAGVRGYTPSTKGFRGYANLDLGYTANYMSYYDDVKFSHGFGLDFGFGVQYKKFTLGYNLNYFVGDGSGTSHWARIGFVF